MAGVNDALSAYLTPTEADVPLVVDAPVQTQVTPTPADAAAVSQAAADPNQNLLLNVASERGNTLATDNQIVKDFNDPNITYNDFLNKYGPNVAADMNQVALGRGELARLKSGARTDVQHITDDTSSVVTGLVGGIGDATTFVAGALNRDAGRFTSESTQTFRDWMGANTQSEDSQQNKKLAGLRTFLDGIDNNKQYEIDKQKSSSFMAGLSYLGRGVVDGAARFAEDPTSLESGLAEGVGSLFAGGAVGRGLGIAGKLAGLGKIVTSAAMPASIGLMEGGSAYTGALQEVMGMTNDELLKSSPTFRDMVAAGIDPKVAKEQVAGRAAEIAGAIQAPVGVLTGKLVAGFEAHPLGSKGFSEMVKNILHETIEEGAQSTSGQLAQNLAVQQTANQDKSLLQDVGDQAAQGAILGGLTAGVVQTPTIPVATLNTAIDALKARASKVDEANASTSGVTPQDIRVNEQVAAENLAPVAQAMPDIVAKLPEEIAHAVDAPSLQSRLQDALTMKPEDLKTLGGATFAYLNDNGLPLPKSKIELIQAAGNIANNDEAPENVRRSAGLFLLDEVQKRQKLFGEDLEETKNTLDPASPEYQALHEYQRTMETLNSVPQIQKTMDEARQSRINIKEGEVATKEDVEDAVRAVQANPASLTAASGRTLLKQSDDGKVDLTPEAKRAIKATVDIHEYLNNRADNGTSSSENITDPVAKVQAMDKPNLDAPRNVDAGSTVLNKTLDDDGTALTADVADQVRTKGGNKKHMLSIGQHIGRVNAAMMAGNIEGAKAALTAFKNFTIGHRNKLRAASLSLSTGSSTEYQAAGKNGLLLPEKSKFGGLHPNQPNSMALGRSINLEARELTDMVNMLSQTYPELGSKQLSQVPHLENIFGKALADRLNGQNNAPQQDEAGQQSDPREETVDGAVDQVSPSLDVKMEGEPVQTTDVAEPTPAESTPEAVPEVVKTPLEEKFPLMVKAKNGVSRFLQAFNLPKKGLSNLMERVNPLVEFYKAANTSDTLQAFIGEKHPFKITNERRDALREYLALGEGLLNGLWKNLKAFEGTKDGKADSFDARLDNGDDIAATIRGKATALLEERTIDGKQVRFYNRTLAETAIVGALNWFAQSQNRISNLDAESIAKNLGVSQDSLSNDDILSFNSGVSQTSAARGIAQMIETFWGLETNKNTPENQVKGIAEGIAKEILSLMKEQGFMRMQQITLSNGQTYNQYQFGEYTNKDIRGILAKMGAAKKLIEIAGVPVDERTAPTYMKAPEQRANTQMRNRFVENTKTQLANLRIFQNVKHYLNLDSYDMQQAIGVQAYINLMGSQEVSEEMNDEHRKTIEGKNLTFGMAFQIMQDEVEEMRAVSEELDIPITEVSKYYQGNYSKVGRLQMLGAVNPQSDKLARHVFMPTREVVDMTNPQMQENFWNAVAQGLGEKTHLALPEENARKAQALVEGIYAPFISELEDWLDNKDNSDLNGWAEKLQNTIGAGKITAHGLMSLLEVAKLNKAEDKTKFVSHNYFEADGINNGAANALMNLTRNVSAQWVETVARVGAYVGQLGQSIADHPLVTDLYRTAAINLQARQRTFAAALPAEIKEQHDRLFRLMSAMDMKLNLNEETGDLTITRNVLKNPLTITIYGSGINGIAANVASELMNAIYAKMTEHMQSGANSNFGDNIDLNGADYGSDLFWSDVNHLVNAKAVREFRNGAMQWVMAPNAIQTNKRVDDFEGQKAFKLNAFEFRTLRDNMRELFVNNMDASIKETVMTHVAPMVDTIQKASNAQSIIMKYMFRREVMKTIANRQLNPDKPAGYRGGESLSQNEFDAIMKRLMPYAARIETGHQTFFLGSGENSDFIKTQTINLPGRGEVKIQMPQEFARTLNKDIYTKSYTAVPSTAGVSVVPSFNIGTGDGRTIDLFIQKVKNKFGYSVIFDGINLPISKLHEGSRMANEAVAGSWTENPAQHVYESFNAFLRQGGLEELTGNDPFNVEKQELLKELTQNALGTFNVDEPVGPDTIDNFFTQWNRSLQSGSEEIGLRIEAMKRLGFSVDQMSGGYAPANIQGTIDLGPDPSPATVADRIELEMKAIRKERKVEETVQRPSKEFVSALRQTGGIDENTGALVVHLDSFNAVRQALGNKVSNLHREMLNAAMNSLKDSDYRLVYGSPETLSRFEQVNSPDTWNPAEDAYYGKIDLENRVIYLSNPSSETLAHELLHAATMVKMQGYFSDPSSVSTNDKDAIERLQGLMGEWLSLSFDKETGASGEAHRMAASAIIGHLAEGRKAAGLNEFLAWSLSNQNIVNIMKKTSVKNRLFMALGDAITALKKLIWGSKVPALGEDMFSQVRFNARVLMATPTPIELFMKDFTETAMYQSRSFGANERLAALREQFGQQIFRFARNPQTTNERVDKVLMEGRRADALKNLLAYNKIADTFARAYGFNMQQKSTFDLIGATIATVSHLNTASLTRMQELFQHVINTVTPADFHDNNIVDEQAREYDAQEKYKALTGVDVNHVNSRGQSSLLPNFIALVAVDEHTREVLRKMNMPKALRDATFSADAYVDRQTGKLADALARHASGEGKNAPTVMAAMEVLTQHMINSTGDARSYIEMQGDNVLNAGDKMLTSFIEKGVKGFQKRSATWNSKIGRRLAQIGDAVTDSLTAEGAARRARTTEKFFNQPEIADEVREGITEVLGRTETNAPIYDMITKVRTLVDQTRQIWRDKFPKQVRSWFAEKHTAREWADIHYAYGKTDAAVLMETHGKVRASELLSSGSERSAEIRVLEDNIKAAGPTQWNTVKAKMEQLADHMLTGNPGKELQPNAHAIAKLNTLDDSVKNIDALVTLYAINKLSQETRDTLDKLLTLEPKGMEQVYAFLARTRTAEFQKDIDGKSLMNYRKGHLPGQNMQGAHLMIDSKHNHADNLRMGYEFMGDYKGSNADIATEQQGYYFSPVSGKAKFNQGTMQTVRPTFFGVDPDTGFAIGVPTAGQVTEPRAVAAISKRIANERNTKENLIPIYSETGRVVGYDRSADTDMLQNLKPEYDLAQAMGTWAGRQSEEVASKQVNLEVIKKIEAAWKLAKTEGRTNEFLDVSKSTNPVVADAWKVIPTDTKREIAKIFGKEGFPVMKSQILDVIGTRSASVGDFWTGNSRWSPEVQKSIRDMIVGFGGNSAYRFLVQVEDKFQGVVTDAKMLIVIKSVVVPAANFINGIWQLSMKGVNVRDIINGYKKKTYELNTYLKQRAEHTELMVQLEVATGNKDSVQMRKLSTRMQVMEDGWKNMSIYPLLAAGEYGAITDGGISIEDLEIAKGGYAALVDKLAQKVPDGLKDVARYAMVTRDTSMFKLLARATQYGDFLAKSVLYDHQTNRKKMSPEEAIPYVNEEFVNFNRFAGRNRAYLESMGLLWFYNFKIRSMKVGQRMIHEQPFRALVHMALTPRIPFIGTLGNPITDSLLSVILKGNAGGSIGLGQLLRAPQLNPWLNIIN